MSLLFGPPDVEADDRNDVPPLLPTVPDVLPPDVSSESDAAGVLHLVDVPDVHDVDSTCRIVVCNLDLCHANVFKAWA